jgi:proteic killer suppression protein
MIADFACDQTQRLFEGQKVKPKFLPSNLHERALGRLQILNAANKITDLNFPPSNRLKKIQGTKDTHEIRVNEKYRIYFDWIDEQPHNVKIGNHL